MYPAVKKVETRDNHVLFVDFDNGECGELDMEPFLDFGVFKKLKDPGFFRRVRVSFDTIAWDSEIDLDPEFVHKKCHILNASQAP